jgi:hypothetical protein
MTGLGLTLAQSNVLAQKESLPRLFAIGSPDTGAKDKPQSESNETENLPSTEDNK